MEHLPSDKDPGILPTEIKKLVDSRREVKKLMAASNITEDLKHQVCTLSNQLFLFRQVLPECNVCIA